MAATAGTALSAPQNPPPLVHLLCGLPCTLGTTRAISGDTHGRVLPAAVPPGLGVAIGSRLCVSIGPFGYTKPGSPKLSAIRAHIWLPSSMPTHLSCLHAEKESGHQLASGLEECGGSGGLGMIPAQAQLHPPAQNPGWLRGAYQWKPAQGAAPGRGCREENNSQGREFSL